MASENLHGCKRAFQRWALWKLPQSSVPWPVYWEITHGLFLLLSAMWKSFWKSPSHKNKLYLVCSFFFRRSISYHWIQNKKRHQAKSDELIPWTKFKALLRKNLGESRSFVDGIWSKFRRDFQYQLKEVWDWASHLEHLQSIFLKFSADGALEESDLIRFFREGPKPSIKAQMDQRGRESDDWETLVEKTVEAEVKTGLQPASYIREIDHWCLRENCSAYTSSSKAQMQGTSIKDPRDSRTEEPKQRSPKVQTTRETPQATLETPPSRKEIGGTVTRRKIWLQLLQLQ